MFRVSLRIVVDASSPVTLPTTSRLAIRPVPQYRIIDKNTMNRRKVNWKLKKKYKKVHILSFLRMIPTDKSNIISENLLFFWTHSLKYCVNELVAFVNQGRLINFYPLHPVYFFIQALKRYCFKKKSNIIFIVATELYKKKFFAIDWRNL